MSTSSKNLKVQKQFLSLYGKTGNLRKLVAYVHHVSYTLNYSFLIVSIVSKFSYGFRCLRRFTTKNSPDTKTATTVSGGRPQLKTHIIRLATMGTGDIKVVLRFVRSPINKRNGTDRRVSYSNRTTLSAIKLSTPCSQNTNGSSSMDTGSIWRSVTVAGVQNCWDALGRLHNGLFSVRGYMWRI